MTQQIADNPKHSYEDKSYPVDQKIKEIDNIQEDKQHSKDKGKGE